jgi:hypothetical protein
MDRVVTFNPASGYRHQTSGAFYATGSGGDYWSTAVTGVNAYYLGFYDSPAYPSNSNARAFGFPVRCVQYLQ